MSDFLAASGFWWSMTACFITVWPTACSEAGRPDLTTYLPTVNRTSATGAAATVFARRFLGYFSLRMESPPIYKQRGSGAKSTRLGTFFTADLVVCYNPDTRMLRLPALPPARPPARHTQTDEFHIRVRSVPIWYSYPSGECSEPAGREAIASSKWHCKKKNHASVLLQ